MAMSPLEWLKLAVFMAALLSVALHGLAASGHFPREHRAPALETAAGRVLLYGSVAVSWVAIAVTIAALAPQIPWYASVIGGGMVLLAVPLLLRPFPDAFVNGRAALAAFSGLAALLAAAALMLQS